MDAASHREKQIVEQPLRQRSVEIALIVLVFFVIGGVPVPNTNETHYLTKAKHYWQPEWCPGDLFLESADAHLVFYWTVGILTRWLSLPTVAWLGRFLAWSLLAWSWQKLSWRLAPIRGASIVTAMLLVTLIEQGNLAGEWVVGGVEGKCFAYVFVFLALAELAVGRWQLVWPLLGLACAFHVLVGGWSVVGALVVWFFEPLASRPRFKQMLPALALGGFLSLPGVIPGLMLTAGVPADVRAEANQIYVFQRLPHHLALHRLPADEIARRFIRFGLMMAGLAALWRFVPRVAKMEDLITLSRIQRFAWASVMICLIGLTWEMATAGSPALSASLLKYYWYRLSDVAVPIAIALSLGYLLTIRADERRLVWLKSGAVILPGVLILATAIERWKEITPVDSPRTREALAWQDVCRWAREKTPQDALFMVPRGASTFRWHAERPVFFTWKDVPQDARSQVVWWQRYQEAYFGAVDEFGQLGPYDSLQDLGAERIRELAAEHKIRFVLTREYPPLPLPVAYENPRYRVYDLRTTE